MKHFILGLMLGVSAMFVGCIKIRLDNAERLMARPDFHIAAEAAPDWTEDALLTINYLESIIERGKAYIERMRTDGK